MKAFPDDLAFMREEVDRLSRVAAVLLPSSEAARIGSTRTGALPDRPLDADWSMGSAYESFHDAESFIFQLNLAEIPAALRRKGWPDHGMVWMFMDLSDDWTVRVEFDPRPADQIPWPETRQLVRGMQWKTIVSWPFATDEQLPQIYWDPQLSEMYWNWCQEQAPNRSSIQIGGWINPIQGDFDESDKTLVAELGHLEFGDCGAVYLHFDPSSRCWSGIAYTC